MKGSDARKNVRGNRGNRGYWSNRPPKTDLRPTCHHRRQAHAFCDTNSTAPS